MAGEMIKPGTAPEDGELTDTKVAKKGRFLAELLVVLFRTNDTGNAEKDFNQALDDALDITGQGDTSTQK